MKKSLWIILGIVLIIAIIVGLYYSNQNKSNETIKIGAILMLTGLGSSYGEHSQMGADLAVNEINSGGGINGRNLEIVYEDNLGDNPSQAVTALNSLISRNIKIILGPNWSPSGESTAPVACENGVILISPSLGISSFNEKCDYIFNFWPHDAIASKQLGEYVISQGYKRIAIVGSLQNWESQQAEAVREGVTNSSGVVVSYVLTSREERDFGTDMLKIKESNPDAVIFTNYGYQELAAKKAREIGINSKFSTVLLDDSKILAAQGAFENATTVTFNTPTQDFINKFQKAYSKVPEVSADTSYDAIKFIANAIRETNSTDTKILKEYMHSVKKYDGASGNITFDDYGAAVKSPVYYTVINGKLVQYG